MKTPAEHILYSWSIMDKDFIYTDMCQTTARFFGRDGYDPDERLSATDAIQPPPELVDSFFSEIREVRNTGMVSRSVALWKMARKIIQTETQKQIIRTGPNAGQVLSRVRYLPESRLYYGNLSGLNLSSETLQIAPGVVIKRRDLTLLHHVVMGINYKTICKEQKIGLPALNARLARIKEKLYDPDNPCYSIQQMLCARNLMFLIMAQPDWFDINPSHEYTIERR